MTTMTPDSTLLMREIPFVRHHPLLPPSSSSEGGSVVPGEVRRRRTIVVVAAAAAEDRATTAGAIGVELTESPATTTSCAGRDGEYDDDSNDEGRAAAASARDDADDYYSRCASSRGMTSVHHSESDGRLIFTSGVSGRGGVVRVIVRDAGSGANGGDGGGGGGGGADVRHGGEDAPSSLEVDMSSLMDYGVGGSAPFDSPVGTAVFVTSRRPSPFSSRDSIDASSSSPVEEGVDGHGANAPSPVADADAGRSLLHLRMVDSYGAVLSLAFTYPNMRPVPGGSFLLPLSPPHDGGGGRRLRPHPGSSVEYNQACFPTPSTVVFALNPHLYCVDLGDGSGAVATTTRVWTNVNNVTSDPIADNRPGEAADDARGASSSSSSSSSATTTPAPKRLRESLGSILTMATYKLMGIPDYDADAECEYADDEDDRGGGGRTAIGGGGAIPPIAALTGMSSSDDRVARVATLHSDGSLRVWTAEPSRRESREGQLRVPSVQRIAVFRGSNGLTAAAGGGMRYSDPPIPNPSTWDPCRDALTLRGKATFDSMSGTCDYEIALYVQCYSNSRNKEESSGSVYIFQGAVVGAYGGAENETRVLPSGDTAKMQALALPKGTASVVDISWSSDSDLMVLLRQRTIGGDGVSQAYYDIGDEMEGGRVILALYPLEGSSIIRLKRSSPIRVTMEASSYSSQPLLPSNMTLPYLEFNHFGYTNSSVEEELDRYMCHINDESSKLSDEFKEMETDAGLSVASTSATNTSAVSNSKAQAQVDRAGLLAILEPFGRNRPSALAVYRAMSSLNLLDDDVSSDGIRPLAILSAMRKWNKRSAFQSSTKFFSSSSALVPANNMNIETSGRSSSIASSSISIYQAFASAAKTSAARDARMNEIIDIDGESKSIKPGANDVEEARESHRMKWIRLLSEIRREEARLDEVLCMTMSANNNFLFRGSMISVVTLDCDAAAAAAPATGALSGQVREIMAGLDELAIDLFTCITSNPDLRQLLSMVESILYDGASKASSFVHGWADKGLDKLLSHLEALGGSAMMRLPITDSQIQLLSELSQLSSNAAETWLMPNLSVSSPVCARLAMSNAFSANNSNQQHSCEPDTLSPATALISARIESIRRLSLSRLVLVFGSPSKNPLTIQHGALRSTLFCTALAWSINQVSSTDKYLTILEQHLSKKINSDIGLSGLTAASGLSDNFVSNFFGDMFGGTLTLEKIEPRVALRLIAPLVEFRSPLVSSKAGQKMREVAADGLLFEAAAYVKFAESSEYDTSLVSLLWRLASKTLLHTATTLDPSNVVSNLMDRIGRLERHLGSMGGYNTALPLCCGVILEAIQDATSAISSLDMSVEMTEAVPALWDTAFQTSMRGRLWDDALQSCVTNPSAAQKRDNFKRLILEMVDVGALGKIIDMSLTVVDRELSMSMRMGPQEGDTGGSDTGVDLFDLAAGIIEEAAVEQANFSLLSEVGTFDDRVLKDRPNYWGCLYALHASRGHWRQAANAMDMFGKATADSVSSSKSNPQQPIVLSKAASMKVMDDACLSSQACVHAISLIDKPSHRYLLPGNIDIPTESRLLTEEDLERRAARALALRLFYMDEYSPDSVGTILETASRDTIDSLARFGYYDQAISVASGVSSKRKGLPGGVDLFDDALKYILCTYLVPAATMSNTTNVGDCGLESLQSRSKIAQIRASSSACALGSAGNTPLSQLRVTSVTANAKSWTSNCQSDNALQSAMAMNLLQQYTTVHSKRCRGLGLNVAKSLLAVGDGVSELPPWLKELCIFGVLGDEESKGGLFAKAAGKSSAGIPDPAGLMRLYIKHHQYGEACDVVASLLSKQRTFHSSITSSSRLPEKGSIDYVPYDLIDMLWNMIESIISSNSSTPSEDIRAQIQLLLKKRNCMEQALETHFESLKTSEEGLISARRLSLHK